MDSASRCCTERVERFCTATYVGCTMCDNGLIPYVQRRHDLVMLELIQMLVMSNVIYTIRHKPEPMPQAVTKSYAPQ